METTKNKTSHVLKKRKGKKQSLRFLLSKTSGWEVKDMLLQYESMVNVSLSSSVQNNKLEFDQLENIEEDAPVTPEDKIEDISNDVKETKQANVFCDILSRLSKNDKGESCGTQIGLNVDQVGGKDDDLPTIPVVKDRCLPAEEGKANMFCDILSKLLNNVTKNSCITPRDQCKNGDNSFTSDSSCRRSSRIESRIHSKTPSTLEGCATNQILNDGVSFDSHKTLACSICDRRFTKKQHLEQHNVIHCSISPFVCDICNKGFTRKQYLNEHKAIHNPEQLFKCKLCNKGFTRKPNLTNHHKLIHDEEEIYTCDLCNKGFKTRRSLHCHKFVHNGNKPFMCEVCKKTFATKRYLLSHKLIHAVVKPVVMCTVCNKGFCKQYFKKHALTHSANKSYTCKMCDKQFKTKQHLKQHELIHAAEKPFICKLCDKGFTAKQLLKNHQLAHSEERPFVCNICDKGFTTKDYLNQHKLIHLDENPCICKICNKGFRTKQHLKQHTLTHHD